jgi:hypothetical protein
MDSSTLLKLRARSQAIYKSNWQPRTASEVTLRRRDISNANNNVLVAGSTHHGPLPQCCSDNTIRVPLPNPGKGFSTTYSSDIVTLRRAGCVDCQDPNFGKPGGVVVQECCVDSAPTPWQPDPLIYGAYITNAATGQFTNVDAQGNSWIVATAADSTQPMRLYNRYGELIQTITDDTVNYNMGCIAYISPDGVTTLWMAKFYYQTLVGLGLQQASIFDSTGNFIIPFLARSNNVLIANSFQLFDRNGTQVFSYTGATNDLTSETFVTKISPTGIWSGDISDPNTWVVRIFNTSVTSTDIMTETAITTDSQNNIILTTYGVNTTVATTRVIQGFDKTNTPFGTAVSLPTGNVRKFVLFKIAAAGTASGSWNSYVFNSVATASYNAYAGVLKITSTDQIVVAFNYFNTLNELRDSANVRIGNVLPFSTGGTGTPWHTCIAVYSPDGLAATSSRAVIRSQTGTRGIVPITVLVDSTNSIYLTIVAQTGTTTVGTSIVEAYKTDDTSVTPTAVTSSTNMYNVCIIKYSSSLTPQWISSVRGLNGSPLTVIGATDNVSQTGQYINAYFDNQQNVIVKGTFEDNTISYFDTTGTLVRTIGTTSANTADGFIWKQPSDGSTGFITRIGFVSAGTEGSTRTFELSVDATNNILVTGWYIDNPVGFYTASDDSTPAVQISAEASGSLNQFLALYTPTLSSVNVAHISLLQTNAFGYPFFLRFSDTTTFYLVGQYQGPISIYNFGNYTATPDAMRGNLGGYDTYICRFSLVGDFWVVTAQGTGDDSVGFPSAIYTPNSQFRLFSNGSINGVVFSAVRPTVFDRTDSVVTSMFDDQTASPSPIAFQLFIPASGYGLTPTQTDPVVTKSASCYCADPGIYRQPFPVDCSIVAPAYTGANNNVTTYGQNFGHLPKQQYPYPSG